MLFPLLYACELSKSKPFQSLSQLIAGEAEDARRLRLIASRALHRLRDERLFEEAHQIGEHSAPFGHSQSGQQFLRRWLWWRTDMMRPPDGIGQMIGQDGFTPAEHQRALQHIAQIADITRPVIGTQQ